MIKSDKVSCRGRQSVSQSVAADHRSPLLSPSREPLGKQTPPRTPKGRKERRIRQQNGTDERKEGRNGDY